MKTVNRMILLATLAAPAFAQQEHSHFIRQHQQTSGIVWDMPVATEGQAPSPLSLESGGALFQLWTVASAPPRDYLLDQKLVGAYLPKAEVNIVTLDPHGEIPRTRVDQPFRVEIQVSDLLTGLDLPQAASSVLLERHVANFPVSPTTGETIQSIDSVQAVSGTPHSSALITSNGEHVLGYDVSSLTATDPTKASGEEHFVIHALPDGDIPQSQIASAKVQVWPVASGEIKGVKSGDRIRFQMPQVELLLHDLYPRSDTFLLLFEGTQYQGVDGKIVKAFPMDRETSESHVLRVTELESKLENDGDYTLVLLSETVFGREMLCPPVTFNIRRTLHVNAMQAGFSDGRTP